MGHPYAVGAAGRHRGVSDTASEWVDISAPAKLNLGLEVLGRRADGYHEIATVLLTVDLLDRLRLSLAPTLDLYCAVDSLSGSDNLAFRAMQALREAGSVRHGARLTLEKAIPAASGLGGASSDAAAALLAARELWRLPVSDTSLHHMAAQLGSDVPFFLKGGCALGRGRGEILERLPVPTELTFLLVVPAISLPRKTATLYANLTPRDFTDGSHVKEQGRRIATGEALGHELLTNAFARPLYSLAPWLVQFPAAMREAGAGAVALSGAGPAHYAPFTSRSDAEAAARRLRAAMPGAAQIFVVAPIPERAAPPQPL
jgi:4-diphosphocytidyl-2-C-methyl-D-erythritol kinase